jgi:hypothetical protein
MCVGVEWIHLAVDRVRWRVIGNTVMKFWDSITGGDFLD